MRNLVRNLKEKAAQGLAHGNRGKPSPKQMPGELVGRIEGILKERYRDFKPKFAVEKLAMKERGKVNDVRYQFSARDVYSRWDRSRAYRRQTSITAACFLEYLERKFPFPIKAIQIDGGSEFKRHFEETCQKREIRLFVLPPHSPKLNGRVERSNRTHREEFYEVEDIDLSLEGHNRQLEKWHDVYNYVRPHQALVYLTPYEYYQSWLKSHRALPSLR